MLLLEYIGVFNTRNPQTMLLAPNSHGQRHSLDSAPTSMQRPATGKSKHHAFIASNSPIIFTHTRRQTSPRSIPRHLSVAHVRLLSRLLRRHPTHPPFLPKPVEDDRAVDEGAEENELNHDVDDQAQNVGAVEDGVRDADAEESCPAEEFEQVGHEVLGRGEVVAREEDDFCQAEEEPDDSDGEDDRV